MCNGQKMITFESTSLETDRLDFGGDLNFWTSRGFTSAVSMSHDIIWHHVFIHCRLIYCRKYSGRLPGSERIKQLALNSNDNLWLHFQQQLCIFQLLIPSSYIHFTTGCRHIIERTPWWCKHGHPQLRGVLIDKQPPRSSIIITTEYPIISPPIYLSLRLLIPTYSPHLNSIIS